MNLSVLKVDFLLSMKEMVGGVETKDSLCRFPEKKKAGADCSLNNWSPKEMKRALMRYCTQNGKLRGN